MNADRIRIDKWLWAARFFKTRALAVTAVDGGKVTVNGARAKKSKDLSLGDVVRIRQGMFETTVIVKAIVHRRGPAKEAALLYEETGESVAGRARTREQLKATPRFDFRFKGKPTKRQRRDIDKLKGRGD
ncbi:MAG: RNA-binding S4 domain-containing protein [Gemmatimonadales bacterium]